MNNELIKDIESKLNIKIDINDILFYNDGATDAMVFSVDDKYLIKTVDEKTLKTQLEFFNNYKNDYFQKLLYSNPEISYLCLEYINGNKLYNEKNLDIKDIITQIYNITSNYKKYNYDGYGYLFNDYNKSWYQFLYDEVIYSKSEIEDINYDKVIDALNVVKGYNIDKYLIHGDFGTHNFLIDNKKIKVIDPMCVVGDYLYDFYFALFSDSLIFTQITLEEVLSFFDRDIEYKKALLIIIVYIRLSRAHKYDVKNYDKFLQLYNKL